MGEGRGAGGRRRRLVLHVCTRFRARDARRTRSGSSSARSARSFVRVRGGREAVEINRNQICEEEEEKVRGEDGVGSALRVDGSDARAATRARETKDRNVRVGRLRPRTFSILSATTFWFALATVSRPIPFQSNAHSCLFACLWVAQKVYSHRHLNPVSPTRLLHAKHLPWFSCTGAAGAAAGDIQGGAEIQGGWPAAAEIVPAPRGVGFGARVFCPGSASGDLTLGARAWLFAACRRGGLPPSSARGCAPRRLFLLTVSSLRRGAPGRRSSLLPVHRDGVVAMNSG